jgi:hypothetical protein
MTQDAGPVDGTASALACAGGIRGCATSHAPRRVIAISRAGTPVYILFIVECVDPPPMMLVIVKGDFDIIGLYGTGSPPPEHPRAKYILYIYNLQTGGPTAITSSQNGGTFRKALNDPSLPDDPTAIPEPKEPTAVSGNLPPPLPTANSKRLCQSNSPAPTIVPVPALSP